MRDRRRTLVLGSRTGTSATPSRCSDRPGREGRRRRSRRACRARLHSLKDLGLRIALDDYGTGYSSLNRLGTLPIDIVKIDKSFIDELTGKSEGTAVIKSVIDVTAALGLTSVAEGVEQQDQCTMLDNLGCNTIQGYLFAKPMPSAATALALTQLRTNQRRLLLVPRLTRDG